jgi:hypothetical protein
VNRNIQLIFQLKIYLSEKFKGHGKSDFRSYDKLKKSDFRSYDKLKKSDFRSYDKLKSN